MKGEVLAISEEALQEVVKAILGELFDAVRALQLPTFPPTRLPRPKVFQITPNISWPYVRQDGQVLWKHFSIGGVAQEFGWADTITMVHLISEEAADLKGYKRAIVRLEQALRWCRKRIEGRQREAKEILRQQGKTADWLRARIGLQALSRLGM